MRLRMVGMRQLAVAKLPYLLGWTPVLGIPEKGQEPSCSTAGARVHVVTAQGVHREDTGGSSGNKVRRERGEEGAEGGREEVRFRRRGSKR